MSGAPPYGYRREGIGETARMFIDETQAQIVQQIFEIYTGPSQISLYALGIPTQCDGGTFAGVQDYRC